MKTFRLLPLSLLSAALLSAPFSFGQTAESDQVRVERDALLVRVDALEAQVVALRDAPPAFTDQRAQVQSLEAQLDAADTRLTAMATAKNGVETELQNLRAQATQARQQRDAAQAELASARETASVAQARVLELEGQLAATSPMLQPDSSARVSELETALATAEAKLSTALRAYTLLQREQSDARQLTTGAMSSVSAERDDLATRLQATTESLQAAQAEIARLTESYGALQRSSAQAINDAGSLRALLQQVQGAQTVLAQENLQLKTALARDPSRAMAPVVTSPAATTGRTHTVADGDTLSRISQQHYGTTGRWQEIFAANRDVLDAQATLRVGMTLRIP